MLQNLSISKCNYRRTYRNSFHHHRHRILARGRYRAWIAYASQYEQTFRCMKCNFHIYSFTTRQAWHSVFDPIINCVFNSHSFLTLNSSSSDARVKPSCFLGLPIDALRRFASSRSACRGIYDGRPITMVFWCLPRRPGFRQIIALFLRPHPWHILSRLFIRSSTL